MQKSTHSDTSDERRAWGYWLLTLAFGVCPPAQSSPDFRRLSITHRVSCALNPSAVSARTLFVLPLAAASLAACSSSRPMTPAPPPPPPVPRVDVAATETLDLGPYMAERPVETPPVEHEVPADLMNNAVREAPRSTTETRPGTTPTRPTSPPGTNRPTRPVFRTVNGYRVQAMQSTNRVEAERAAQTAMAWWRRTRGGSPEVYLVYRAPYYRVRVGNYAERGEADRVARSLNASFPNAFAVPDRVTVRQQAED